VAQNVASSGFTPLLHCLANFPRNAVAVLCEVEQLTPSEDCANTASYAITVSYLGRPTLTLHLCKAHILDTWHLAQQNSLLLYGNSVRVKAVAVKKL
jgi:hypothetical protein